MRSLLGAAVDTERRVGSGLATVAPPLEVLLHPSVGHAVAVLGVAVPTVAPPVAVLLHPEIGAVVTVGALVPPEVPFAPEDHPTPGTQT